MIKAIPLNKLIASPRNVRRLTDEQADRQLEADIAARGLLQNLVVSPSRKPRGSFAVEGGGRRLRALQALADAGAIEPGFEVPCLVLESGPDQAREASLAENFQRLAMNPADECRAFQLLIEDGADAETIARRFGLTVRFVEGRLRLASLAPTVFAALEAAEISLEVAKAYGCTADVERQASVFEQVRGTYSANHADSIRRLMTQASVSASDRRARLVGEDAYVAAGGRIERDLFADGTGGCWLDLPLLERLAGERMDALAADWAENLGFAWVRPTLDPWVSCALTADLERIVPDREPLTAEEEARIAAAGAEIDRLYAMLEAAEVSDDCPETATRIEELEREIATIRDKPQIIDGTLRPMLGTFLLLDQSGEPRLDTAFYMAPQPGAGAGDAEDDDVVEQPEHQAKPLSRALIDELAIQRRDILAATIAGDDDTARDLAIFIMVDRDPALSRESAGSSLRASAPSDQVAGFKTPDAWATQTQARILDRLDRSWTSGETRSARFDAFRALPLAARSAWLASAVSRTLEASANASGRQCAFHDHLGVLLEIDVAEVWRPTAANYFDRVPKSITLGALEEIGGAAFVGAYAKMKKAELCAAAERICAGEAIMDPALKQRALAWVPEPMRFAAAVEGDGGGDGAKMDSDAAGPLAGAEHDGRDEQERGANGARVDSGKLSPSFEEAA